LKLNIAVAKPMHFHGAGAGNAIFGVEFRREKLGGPLNAGGLLAKEIKFTASPGADAINHLVLTGQYLASGKVEAGTGALAVGRRRHKYFPLKVFSTKGMITRTKLAW
jgi:hypothetical protein